MLDELKFAIKCGGSTKKVQINNSTISSTKITESAITKPTQIQAKSNSTSNLVINSSSMSNLVSIGQQHHLQKQSSLNQPQSHQPQPQLQQQHKRECKKCQRLKKERLANNDSPLQTAICKHHLNATSMTSLNGNNNNAGLILIEKESSLDAQNITLKSSAYSNPHLYQQQHQQLHHQQTAKHHQPQFQHNSNLLGNKKCPNKRIKNYDSAYEKNNNDYILMKSFNQHGQPCDKPSFVSTDIASHQIIPINIDRELNFNNNQYFDKPQEQQINYDRYLSKSNIMKTAPNKSNTNRH
jgi:hypothetical protein